MKTYLRIACSFATLALLAASVAVAAAQTSRTPAQADNGASSSKSKLSATDRRFMTNAIQGDLAEIKMGELAQRKGGSDAAKKFGQMLQQDHSQHLDKAKALAQQSGIVPPTQPADAKQKAAYDRLSKLSGAQFDRQFARAMVSDHKKDISKYRKEAGTKGPLADFAQQTIPTLEKHLQTAENLSSQQSSRR